MGVVRRNLIAVALALGLALGGFAGMPRVAVAASVPISIGTVHGAFYSNPNNSGQLDLSNLVTPVFTQDFPVLDFNPPGTAQVSCSNNTGIGENTRPFTDVVPNPDGTCSTIVAQGGGQQAGVGNLFTFQGILSSNLSVSAQGQVTFNFYSDDGWMLGAGHRQGGTEQPSYVSGSMVNPLSTTPGHGLSVVGSYNVPSAPAQNQVTVNFPVAGIYPIEVDYTECCGGQLALVLGTTFGNPIPPSGNSFRNVLGTVVTGQPTVPTSWTLGSFDYDHLVTGGEPLSCFVSPGCNIDNLGAAIQWGDQSANSAGTVMCMLAPYPFPPPRSAVEHCRITGTHTYSTSGTYLVTLTLSPSGPAIRTVAQIFPSQTQVGNFDQQGNNDQGNVARSIGELVGFDLTPNVAFPLHLCTATVLHSISKNLIVTAGHCVLEQTSPTQRFTNFSFAPSHHGPSCLNLASCGTNPFGVWTATSADVVVNSFVSSDCLPSVTCGRFDFAFITLHPNQTGQNVEDAVGGISLELNGPTTGSWTAFGYPYGSAIPNRPGTYQLFFRHCGGTSFLSSNSSAPGPPGPPDLEMPCNQALTPGASGGPWFDNSTGMVGALNKGFVNNSLLGTYLSDAAGQDYLNASLPH